MHAVDTRLWQTLKWPNYLYFGKEGRLVDEDGAKKDEDVRVLFFLLQNAIAAVLPHEQIVS